MYFKTNYLPAYPIVGTNYSETPSPLTHPILLVLRDSKTAAPVPGKARSPPTSQLSRRLEVASYSKSLSRSSNNAARLETLTNMKTAAFPLCERGLYPLNKERIANTKRILDGLWWLPLRWMKCIHIRHYISNHIDQALVHLPIPMDTCNQLLLQLRSLVIKKQGFGLCDGRLWRNML